MLRGQTPDGFLGRPLESIDYFSSVKIENNQVSFLTPTEQEGRELMWEVKTSDIRATTQELTFAGGCADFPETDCFISGGSCEVLEIMGELNTLDVIQMTH